MPDYQKLIATLAMGLAVFLGHQVWDTASQAHDMSIKNAQQLVDIHESVSHMSQQIDELLRRK